MEKRAEALAEVWTLKRKQSIEAKGRKVTEKEFENYRKAAKTIAIVALLNQNQRKNKPKNSPTKL